MPTPCATTRRSRSRPPRNGAAWLGLGLLLAGSAMAAAFDAPLINWVLPVFTENNHRLLTARGGEARAAGPHQFDVVNLNLTFFNGEAEAHADTVILSPAARFDVDARTAQGEKSVRFIRDEVEASGTRWTYWHEQKKISLDGNVRVTFRAELPELLK